jgi:small multidrug resistance family-3 protein
MPVKWLADNNDDGFIPDKFDVIGGAIALFGMAVIMFVPRN